MKITIIGSGYVGFSNAILLSNNDVTILDIDERKINQINQGEFPIHDDSSSDYHDALLRVKATNDYKSAYKSADIFIYCLPTDFDDKTNSFNTKLLKNEIIKSNKINPNALMIIRSTVPIGFTDSVISELGNNNICFIPEFLRENTALNDNHFPERLVVGSDSNNSKKIIEIFTASFKRKPKNILVCKPKEAEAIKLFANAYLAMRVAYFNELDNFAFEESLDAEKIITGVSSDSRIGMFYNNPSFGYGGYCLPKDTKQLLSNYSEIPTSIFKSIIESNKLRKNFIVEKIIEMKPKVVGIYRLIMKSQSSNFRSSSIWDIAEMLNEKGIKIFVYEPLIVDVPREFELISDFDSFVNQSDLIVTNRISSEIKEYSSKIFSRDIFSSD